jgi:CRISPR-associated protein Csm3
MSERHLPDMSTFHSQLVLCGRLELKAGLRVGAGRDTQIEAAADLPVVKTVDGKPYIPGASFKGAWRATTESLLRGLPDSESRNLACISVPRDEESVPPRVCLTTATVSCLKAASPAEWATILDGRAKSVDGKTLDEALRMLSCWTCRLFGAPWLAGKVLVKDLNVVSEWRNLTQPDVRDGVAIDRDKRSAVSKRKYTYETVPAGTSFGFETVIENASDAELGLAWLGLLTFQRGWTPLGGARSRGLGWCELEIDWTSSRWLNRENLIESLFPDDTASVPASLAETGLESASGWLNAFLQETGLEGGA